MSEWTTILVKKTTRAKLDKYQKSKKLRTRDDALVSLLEGSK
jgi:hypothetical protein